MKFLRNIIRLCVVTGGLVLAAGSTWAAPRVAIIEAGQVAAAGLMEFSLLSDGTEFELAAGETITIGYLKSCISETITGGNVVIGTEESVVTGGKVVRSESGQCVQPQLDLTAADSQQSASLVVRGDGLVKILHQRSPILRSRAGNTLFVEIVPIQGGAPMKLKSENGVIDFAAENIELQPGQSYYVKTGKNSVQLDVASGAKVGGRTIERVVLID
jgi:hypothetical protein